jgi:cytochrome P450
MPDTTSSIREFITSGIPKPTDYLERLDAAPAEEKWPLARKWLFEEPFGFFAELRKQRPVLVLPELTIAARHADCENILQRYDAFTVELYVPKQGFYWMDQDDTAVHWREKSVMKAILDREEIPDIRAYVGAKATELLAAGAGKIDAVNGLGRAVPIALVQDKFGFVDSNPDDLCKWSYWSQMDAFWNQSFNAGTWFDHEKIILERKASSLALGVYLTKLLARRTMEVTSGHANNDPMSRLLRLSFTGAVNFSVDRVALNVGGLLIGAVETTQHAVANALEVLFAVPELLQKAREAAKSGPDAFDGYVFEALRFKPAFPYFFRTCSKPTVLSGDTQFAAEIQPGTNVLAITHSAMFDPAVFPNPETFDPTRPVEAGFTFGLGMHECLGRAIGRVMIPEIVRRCLLLDGIEPAAPVDYRGGPVPESYLLKWNA